MSTEIEELKAKNAALLEQNRALKEDNERLKTMLEMMERSTSVLETTARLATELAERHQTPTWNTDHLNLDPQTLIDWKEGDGGFVEASGLLPMEANRFHTRTAEKFWERQKQDYEDMIRELRQCITHMQERSNWLEIKENSLREQLDRQKETHRAREQTFADQLWKTHDLINHIRHVVQGIEDLYLPLRYAREGMAYLYELEHTSTYAMRELLRRDLELDAKVGEYEYTLHQVLSEGQKWMCENTLERYGIHDGQMFLITKLFYVNVWEEYDDAESGREYPDRERRVAAIELSSSKNDRTVLPFEVFASYEINTLRGDLHREKRPAFSIVNTLLNYPLELMEEGVGQVVNKLSRLGRTLREALRNTRASDEAQQAKSLASSFAKLETLTHKDFLNEFVSEPSNQERVAWGKSVHMRDNRSK